MHLVVHTYDYIYRVHLPMTRASTILCKPFHGFFDT